MSQCTAIKHLLALCYAKVTVGKVDTLKDKERWKKTNYDPLSCTFTAEAGGQKATCFLWNDHWAKCFVFFFFNLFFDLSEAFICPAATHWQAPWFDRSTHWWGAETHPQMPSKVSKYFFWTLWCSNRMGPTCDTILAWTWTSMGLIQVIQAFDRDSVFSNSHNVWKQGKLHARPTNPDFSGSPQVPALKS